jgi:dihydroneopterin triphosphate diphosphatase
VRQPIQVLVYITRQSNGDRQYLLLHRAPHRDAFWQGVTGGVEPGETVLEAACRELAEETGYVAAQVVALDYTYTFPVADSWREVYGADVTEIREHTFLVEVPGITEPSIDPREHDAWQWCGFEEALSLLRWPENITALRHAHAWLQHPTVPADRPDMNLEDGALQQMIEREPHQ